ncbi:MAG: ATP-dependent RecD-like DNA helicase [Bacteroidetes bacterium]|nr:ATP-dependent RecD-like DNA helicase [Bacteroidota bacterium]
MTKNYDLQDSWGIAMIEADFQSKSSQDWQEYIEFATHNDYWKAFSKFERDILYQSERNAKNTKRLSSKQMLMALKVAEKIDNLRDQQEKSEEASHSIESATSKQHIKHVTFRVAWHDNKWDGTICANPFRNRYCSGFNSLLSERIRKRKAQNINLEELHKGSGVSLEYVPPCFWGINVFGSKDISIEHDNPAESKLNHINETLPSQSLFSWPFSISFTRDNDQFKLEGSYPKNLEEVRIPRFNSKIHKNQSVAFIYTKFSNPLTEEEQQYLVIGCGLVTDKGAPTWFEPFSIIEEKRASKSKLRNFPSMNWALRYSLSDSNLLVRMPYHEYLEYVDKPGIDEEKKQKYLEKIKVAITEPELEHCFKYVAMDIDDDEAIYILSKMRQRLIDCEKDGIVPIAQMNQKIRAIDELLEHCWIKRSYFPGFGSICREMLNWDKPEFLLDEFVDDLQGNEGAEYAAKFLELISKPSADPAYKKYMALLREVKSRCLESYGLGVEQFLHLCMLNLKPFQFKRVLDGKLILSGDWKKTIDDEKRSHDLTLICDNPYLLFEEYKSYDSWIDDVTGEEKDNPIELFKIDVAYFPDTRFGIDRIELQTQMKYNDKRRIRALLIRFLSTLENTGHCFADASEVENALKNYPLFYNAGADYQLPGKFFDNLSNDYVIHFEENDKKLKIISANDTIYYYLNEVYRAEQEIEEVIELLLQEKDNSVFFEDIDAYLMTSIHGNGDKNQGLNEKFHGHFDEALFIEERKRLYENIYKKKFFVLAGNPGSGKSHELLNIITDFKKKGQKYLLLAPTGKATLRLKTDSDFPEIEAFTIDKFMADIRSGKVSKTSVYEYQNLIIDEMSMVDLMKLRDLFRLFNFKIPSFQRLILVGDPHQLPAIGYGKVLKDILYFLSTHPKYSGSYIELQTNCRQELAESQILEFSDGYITDGEISPALREKIMSADVNISKGFRVHFWQSEEELNKKVDEEFEYLCNELKIEGPKLSKLNLLFKLKADGHLSSKTQYNLEYFQILSPYRSDFFGTGHINDYIQMDYKKEQQLELMDNLFKQSDKIIRTKNYYVKNRLILSNGSIGFIRKDKEPMLYFPELEEPMLLNGADGIRSGEQEYFDLAFAITVHKSQGSGFNHIFFVLPKKSSLLSKELIYTALSRSRESLTIFVQGQTSDLFEKSVFEKARLRSYTESRRTSLLLDKPFRYYALEADGKFIESRVELLIYQALKDYQNRVGVKNLSFVYEVVPVIDGQELPMKTDFTVVTNQGIWYWEHLGRLGNKKYEWTWQQVKKPSYQQFNAYDKLLTTHERNGINPDKIKEIITLLVENRLSTEDTTDRYSKHHYSLR